MTDTADVVLQRLLVRRWENVKRAGVDHYVPGQHVAERALAVETGEETYLLAYAAGDGHGIIVLPCERAGDAWKVAEENIAIRADGFGVRFIYLSDSFDVSMPMIEALERARPTSVPSILR